MVTLSLELFPPATVEGRETLVARVERMAQLQPSFVSVTYGAGGTSQDRTIDTLAALGATVDVPLAGHLTTVGATREQTQQVVDRYRQLGISRIVALRGDRPEGSDELEPAPGYASATDLVAGLRARSDGDQLELSVAAYPEVHPLADSAGADLENLRLKVEAGADRAITQFFFDPEVFLRFREHVTAAGIDVPLVPGLLPITSFAKVSTFAAKCGTAIPSNLADRFETLTDDPAGTRELAAEVAIGQARTLVAEGVDQLHLYTLNQAELSLAVGCALGVGTKQVMAGSGTATAGGGQ